MRRLLTPIALFCGVAALCYALRRFGLPGGDTELFMSNSFSFYWYGLGYYTREPLPHFLISQTAQHVTGNLVNAFALVGALSGGIWAVQLAAWARPIRERWKFLLPNLLTIIPLMFIGHIELYAVAACAFTLWYWLLARELAAGGQRRVWPVTAAFVLTFFAHKSAVFYLPIMAWLLLDHHGPGWGVRAWRRRVPGRRDALLAMGCLLGMIALDTFAAMQALYHWLPLNLDYFSANEPFLDWLTPLTPGMARALEARSQTGMFYWFTFGTLRHWEFFFGFLAMGAPLGLPLLITLRRRITTPAAQALFAACVIGIVWTLFWHPRVLWRDWSLFVLASIPVNLLAGGLWARHPWIVAHEDRQAEATPNRD